MAGPGKLIASGRDSDIFECGAGLVLRRSREGRSMQDEARVMEFVRAEGYPAPRVHEVSDDGTDLVMERLDGPTLLDVMIRSPLSLRRHAATLAELHHRLHAIEAPAWIRQFDDGGDRFIHLDLHPLNVIVTRDGPVVIDWTNTARGHAGTDVAVTWLLLASARPGGIKSLLVQPFRRLLLRFFLDYVDRADAAAHLHHAMDLRANDMHLSDAERAAMAELVAREGTG